MNLVETIKIEELFKANNIARENYPYFEQLKSIIKINDAGLFLVGYLDHSIEGVLEEDHNITFDLKLYNRKLEIEFEFNYSYRGGKSIINTTIIDDIVSELIEKIQMKIKAN